MKIGKFSKVKARHKARLRWIEGRLKDGLPLPTPDEERAWKIGFHMAWNIYHKLYQTPKPSGPEPDDKDENIGRLMHIVEDMEKGKDEDAGRTAEEGQ